MTDSYSIGELAKAGGIPASTIRYYERRGLLSPDGRSAGNYRVYGDASLERLRFIRAAQASGFQLRDIELLMQLREGEGNPCGEVRGVIEGRLGELKSKLKELRHAQRVLERALEWCKSNEAAGRCGVLDKLAKD